MRRSYDEESAEKAVQRLEELGLVDDERFAQRYADQLVFGKHMSKRAAGRELALKGIDRELADEILEELEVDAEEQIRAVLDKKYRVIRDEKTKRRAVAALQRLGYGWDEIKRVIDEYTEEDFI